MMNFDRKNFSDKYLLHLYRQLLLPRMIEEKMLILLRQGKISKWFSGIGQEAISVGAMAALEPDEWVMPLHRNLGVFTGRNMPLRKLFMQWQGNKDGYSNGRERSFHFGSAAHHVCGMISHLGPQLTLANGTALAYKLRNEKKVSLAFTGDGGTSEGDFHEALNVAAVWDLPVIFIIENNGYGLSTPVQEQYRCQHLADRAKGYGMEGVRIDGNNILTVVDTIQGVREYCIKQQRPYLIECTTFRMRGHEEASGIKYVPQHLFDEWRERDPIEHYEKYLLQTGVISKESVANEKASITQYIDTELAIAYEPKEIEPDEEAELEDVYKPVAGTRWLPGNTNHLSVISHQLPENKEESVEAGMASIQHAGKLKTESEKEATTAHHTFRGHAKGNQDVTATGTTIEAVNENGPALRFIDAIQQGLHQSMKANPNLIFMGQDIAEYGGAFKITEGFMAHFGKERVRNTPLCESAIIGAALGLSLEGCKSMVEMQFADFVTSGFNQIVNSLAKIHYRWGQAADVVIRMPAGGGVGAGPFHSQSNEAWFVHTPGLKVVYPSTPQDAKGLLIAAINDPNPVLYFEHKALYRSVSGPVPEQYFEIEIGKARVVKAGNDATIITYGLGVHWAMEYQQQHPHLSLSILDLRTLLPLDYSAIKIAVAATGKVLVLHEDTLTGGIGGEISAWIAQHCFELLDAPVMRCASLDTPVPFNLKLEEQFMAKSRLGEMVNQLIHY